MSRGTVHVVGTGVAGLVAALATARSGRPVRLYDAAKAPGGRCRTVEGAAPGPHDNGTHAILGANRHALAFLEAIGARESWVEPEPAGLPLIDFAANSVRRVALSPWAWLDPLRRPPGLDGRTLLRLLPLLLPGPDRPVAACIGSGGLARAVLGPLAVAALNTPPEAASARRLAMVLRRLLLPGAGRLLVARRGLGPDLVAPALATLARLGVPPPRLGDRLERLATGEGRAVRLEFAQGPVTLGPADAVVLALPPQAASALAPGLRVPERFEPIVNLHFAVPYDGSVRFAGLLGATAQWLLLRPGIASVTVSAARALVGLPGEDLAARLWPEARWAAARLGVGLWPAALPPWRAVKERRATPSQTVGARPPVSRTPFRNVTLAGDWLSPLPATIEAAVRAGMQAALRA